MLTGSPDAVMTDLAFSGNTATGYGGGMSHYLGNLTLTDVDIIGNTAVYGEGIHSYTNSPALTAVTFSNNWGDFGGGMYNNASSPTLSDMTFTENTGLYGAGIYNEEDSSPELTAVTFANNQANWNGGGLHNINDSSPSLTNVAPLFTSTAVTTATQDSLYTYPSRP